MSTKFRQIVTTIFSLTTCMLSFAQTDLDAIMMPKKNFCGGVMYGYSSWKNYWEGTFKRDNQNLGTVSTSMISMMGNYGITDKLNLLVAVPYVKTNASGGTLKGQQGIQDLSLTIKYMPLEKDFGPGTISLYSIGSVSAPLTNYVADYLPLSIGNRSKTATVRLMADYQVSHVYVTLSGAYIARKNIEIDRTAYYTTQMHYTNEVSMPDVINCNARAGFRNERLIAEAVFDVFNTQGGYDIRKNDMPFPNNEMNASRLGFNVKYNLGKKLSGLSAVATGNYVLAGRNIGQSSSLMLGAFYQMDWSKKVKKTKKSTSGKESDKK